MEESFRIKGEKYFMNKKVYIIILNYNGWQDTIECLESVLKSDYNNYQIVVVDNYSPNNSMDYLKKWAKGELCLWLPDSNPVKRLSFPLEKKPLEYVFYTKEEALKGGIKEKEEKYKNPLIFIQAGENRGFAAGNNIGIKYALVKDDFEYIWLLNNDTVIKKDTLSKLINYADINHIGICGSVLKYYDNPNEIQAYGGKINRFFGTTSHNKNINELKKGLDYIVGASFMINKKVINKIGLMDENYFLYMEETDYCFNAKNNGFKLGVAIDSIVYHKEGASTGSTYKYNDNKSEFVDLLSIKNRIKFHKKYLGEGMGLYIGLFFTILNRIRRKQYKRVLKILNLIKEEYKK
ncbi:glycosyl transferase, family 2 [Caminibacter mediatlanticus TB-2]|uniref:Glycosyl transferase, family 2 n=2 Tax=Caminibacter mediatlanticus TaxID=291048 RepID=A0AAI9AGG7_9BACT|nr:glycosyl transferase, family 2 [Caminibacter mediatlanticus TB-2]